MTNPRIANLEPCPYGVNAHLAADAMLEQLGSAGVRWLRIDVNWNDCEPAMGAYSWGDLDRVCSAAHRHQQAVLASVAYTPAWATASGRHTDPPRDPDDWSHFIREFVGRFGDRLAAIGIWNEPNLRDFFTGTKDEYLQRVFLPGLRAARAAKPDLVTAGPDLSSSPSNGNPLKRWLGPALDVAGDLLDVVTHHQYDGHDTVSGRAKAIDELHEFLESRGDRRPLWITEIGWHTDHVTPETQGVLLRGVMREMAKRDWWAKTFWYDSHGPGWGLFEPDVSPRRGKPRPAFAALDEVVSVQPSTALTRHPEDARVLVEHAYLGILGRTADSHSLLGYGEFVEHGGEIAELCRALFTSGEFVERRSARTAEQLLSDLYSGILDRTADAEGIVDYIGEVRAGRLDLVAAAMLNSREFEERFLGAD